MIAVIFEVVPRADQKDAYLAAAASLRQHLEHLDGFISIDSVISAGVMACTVPCGGGGGTWSFGGSASCTIGCEAAT